MLFFHLKFKQRAASISYIYIPSALQKSRLVTLMGFSSIRLYGKFSREKNRGAEDRQVLLPGSWKSDTLSSHEFESGGTPSVSIGTEYSSGRLTNNN